MPNESTAPATVQATPTAEAPAQPTQADSGDVSLKDAVKQANETPAEAIKRKLKVKINDAEQELDEDEVVAGYQLRRASDSKFQEAARLRKEAEEIIGLFKSNPRKALEHPAIGADVRKMAEEILSEHLEEELSTPEQKRIRELEKKLAEQESRDRAKAEAEEKAKSSAAETAYITQAEKDITSALQTSGLPRTNRTVGRMIHYMQNALRAGHDVKPSEVVELVKEDYQNDIKELFGAADGATLAALLGEDGLKKVRTHDLSRLKDPKVRVSADRQPEPRGDQPKPRKTLKEILSKI